MNQGREGLRSGGAALETEMVVAHVLVVFVVVAALSRGERYPNLFLVSSLVAVGLVLVFLLRRNAGGSLELAELDGAKEVVGRGVLKGRRGRGHGLALGGYVFVSAASSFPVLLISEPPPPGSTWTEFLKWLLDTRLLRAFVNSVCRCIFLV